MEDGYQKQKWMIYGSYLLGSLFFIGVGVAFHKPLGTSQGEFSSKGTSAQEKSLQEKKEKCIKNERYPETNQWHSHSGCEE